MVRTLSLPLHKRFTYPSLFFFFGTNYWFLRGPCSRIIDALATLHGPISSSLVRHSAFQVAMISEKLMVKSILVYT